MEGESKVGNNLQGHRTKPKMQWTGPRAVSRYLRTLTGKQKVILKVQYSKKRATRKERGRRKVANVW